MATGGGGEALTTGAAGILASPAVRNASLACLAAASLLFSIRFFADRQPPRVPDKDAHLRRTRMEQEQGSEGHSSQDSPLSRAREQESRLVRRSSSYASAVASGSTSKNAIAIFWDVDNCSPHTGASGHEVTQAIRMAAQSIGPDPTKLGSIVSFKAYLELSSESLTPNASQVQLRSELQGSGVSLIDTPKSGRKDVADKMMIADLLSFAIDKRPPALIVLLSGDRDFAYPLGILRNRGYEILLITPPVGATPILEASANYKLRWRQDVLGIEYDASGRPYNRAKGGNGANTVSQVSRSLEPSGLIPDSVKRSDPSAIPPVFQPLVNVLEQLHKEGQPRPLRSLISMRLKSIDPKVFERAQASGWGEYVAIAEAAGIVTLGQGMQFGMEWIALRNRGPVPQTILKRPSPDDVPANAASTPAGNEIAIFYPLIEAYKALKAGMPATKEPLAREVALQLNNMKQSGFADPYTQANVSSFDQYIKLAFRARVARLAPAERGEIGPVVHLHPRYATMHTGLVMPSNPTARMMDTTNVPAPEARQNRFAALLSNRKPDADIDGAPSAPATLASGKENFGAYDNEKGKVYPHQPSGEQIHITYFPLANMLLTQRAEGNLATPETLVHATISKHYKMGRLVQDMEAFGEYISRATADDIVTVTNVGGERFVQLHPRLCKGEGENRHKGFAKGYNSYVRFDRSEDHADQRNSIQTFDEESASPQSTHKETLNSVRSKSPSVTLPDPIIMPSPQFASVPSTAQDRLQLKPLVDALVLLRKRATAKAANCATKQERMTMLASAIEPLRATVATTLVKAASGTVEAAKPMRDVNGAGTSGSENELAPALAPGAWLQMHGYNSFGDLFGEAERKGFVHLVIRDGRERVRLAKRYEDMFFPQ